MKILFAVFLISSLSYAPASPTTSAEEWDGTGNALLKRCSLDVRAMDGERISSSDSVDATFCLGYLSGVIDSDSMNQRLEADDKDSKPLMKHVCVPNSASMGQASRITVKWLRENPDKLHYPAPVVAIAALRRAFPCS